MKNPHQAPTKAQPLDTKPLLDCTAKSNKDAALEFHEVSYAYKLEDSPFAPLVLGEEPDSPTSNSAASSKENEGTKHAKRPNALTEISLEIAKGSFVCIIGSNGSGKSTLAQHINALKIPDKGFVLTLGLDTSNTANTQTVRSSASMIFQNPDNQIVASLVKDEVAFGPRNLGLAPEEIERRAQHALALVGLQGFEHRHTHTLSGGQKQRLAIAGALAMNPEILILDEASSMLDPRGRTDLMRIVRQLHASGITIIMLTHFMDEVLQANKLVILEAGKLAFEGSPWEAFSLPELSAHFNLELPLICLLAKKLDCLSPNITSEEDLLRTLEAKLTPIRQAGLSSSSYGTKAQEDLASMQMSANKSSIQEVSSCSGQKLLHKVPLLSCKHLYFSYDKALAKRASKLQAKYQKRHNNTPDAPPAEAIFSTLKKKTDITWALEDVSFDLYPGEFIGLAGHTGSGKSSLIQHCNALLVPSLGQVLFKGSALQTKHDRLLVRSKVGLVFQYPEHQLFAPTILEDVMFGPLNQGLSFTEAQERARWALGLVGFAANAWEETSPFSLSGGQQRLVALAGILALKPELLILDEPTSSLDPHMARFVLELIARLNQEEGMSVVLVSHNMDELSRYCSRILFMREGKLVANYPCHEAFNNSDFLRSMGLGLPSHKDLAETLIHRGVGLTLESINSQEDLFQACMRLAAQHSNSTSYTEGRNSPSKKADYSGTNLSANGA